MRARCPAFGQHLQHRRADGRRPRIAALQLVEAALQFFLQARSIHAELVKNLDGVAAARIQQLHQEVLYLDVIMRAR